MLQFHEIEIKNNKSLVSATSPHDQVTNKKATATSSPSLAIHKSVYRHNENAD